MKTHLRTSVHVSIQAIRANMRTLRKQVASRVQALAVVKADAYGHGLAPVARAAIEGGATYLAVFDIQEGVLLRKAGIKTPVLVLRSILPEEVALAVTYNLELAVSTFELLTHIAKKKYAKPVRIHLMTDTGLGRDGFLLADSTRVLALIAGNKHCVVVGLATHFAASEMSRYDAYTVAQVTAIFEWKKMLHEIGVHPIVHASATAGIFLSPEFGLDMVRFGIGIYGLWPSDETALRAQGVKLTPALSWHTYINEVKRLPAGSYVGYDLTEQVTRDSVVAVLPVGYSDGYPRSASNRGFVLVRGKRARILGRIMMNMMVVDITDIPNVRIGDTVTLIGKDKTEILSAEEVALHAGTINYELVTRIATQVPRIYTK